MHEFWICPGEPEERPRIMTGKCSNPRHKPFKVRRISDMGHTYTKANFEKELESLINRHCIENEWDMPDFIMSKMITEFIYSTGKYMKQNLDWHGVDSVCHPKNNDERTTL